MIAKVKGITGHDLLLACRPEQSSFAVAETGGESIGGKAGCHVVVIQPDIISKDFDICRIFFAIHVIVARLPLDQSRRTATERCVCFRPSTESPMLKKSDPLAMLARKLGTRSKLNQADEAAILALPYVHRTHDAADYLVREGAPLRKHCAFVVSGYAFRQKLTANGARQIVSLHMAGDLLDIQHLFLKKADHNVQALTRLETAEVDRQALQALALERPAVARAMWIDTLVDASIFREWVINVGRRDARSRIAHLLCEFATRMDAAGLGDRETYELPMTQEQIGDATGLTSVHVNRTLKSLAEAGLLHRDRRYLRFDDWSKMRETADFSALYLHLDQTAVDD